MDIKGMVRIPVDPRVVEKIERSPSMMAEQGPGFMGSWGSPSTYRVLAQLPKNQRMVYASVLDGATDQSQIEIMTGLSPEDVSRTIDQLTTKGLVTIEKTV